MKHSFKHALVAAAALLSLAACSSKETGDGEEGSGGEGGAPGSGAGKGGGTPATTSGSGTPSSSSTGAGGPGDELQCGAFFAGLGASDECPACIDAACCDLAEACLNDPACAACIQGDEASCDQGKLGPLGACVYEDNCKVECAIPICDSGFTFGLSGEKCGTCLGGNCCAEYTACNGDADCTACLVGSGDPATCAKNEAKKAVDACYGAECGAECPTAICGSGLTQANPTCGKCLNDSCCANFTSCAADATCLSCITGATPSADPACAGSDLFKAASGCQKESCAEPCSAG